MIKRTESKSPSKPRRSKRAKRRRMMMENLESRQLLAAEVFPLPDVELPVFTGARNIGTVPAFTAAENEPTATSGANDSFATATFLPLGTGDGQEDTIDVTGNMGFTVLAPATTLVDGTPVPPRLGTDIDVYSFDLRAGDILDIATLGSAGPFSVHFESGEFWYGANSNTALVGGGGAFFATYPPDSPLQTVGLAVGAQVAPTTGRYYLVLSPANDLSNYTIGLRAYRPSIEQTAIGSQQVIFVDMDGGFYPASEFDGPTDTPTPGIVRYPTLLEGLGLLGIEQEDDAAFNALIDRMLAEMELEFQTLVANGVNGDFDATGVPGEYGVTILNSRDHVDPGNHPLVTRIMLGGTATDTGISTIGLANSIDVGNFSMDDLGFVIIDLIQDLILEVPIGANATVVQATADFIAQVVAHEAGHTFGIFHTDNANTIESVMDTGRAATQALPLGDDGIFGTIDDGFVEFAADVFQPGQADLVGIQRVPQALSLTLATGTIGTTLSGTVFNDANGDGNNVADSGLAGVTVFADINGNGVQDPSEAASVSLADGSFTLATAPGSFNLVAITPDAFRATTAVSVPVTAGQTGVEFGFLQVVPDITGTKYADLNGNGVMDANEPGLGGVYIYLDLDGDDRPDLGEPGGQTNADGTYSINFPGPGTYTIREVLTPGFIQTEPAASANGEHIVVFDGTALSQNFNFGNLPSRDFGDAPDSYLTTQASGGPSHGITAGLSLGAVVDRELDGVPSQLANADDLAGRASFDGSITDDEDGVRLLSPIGPGDTSSFEITVNNATGTGAFLQAFMDFNLDGDFNDAGERIANDLQLATGTHILPFDVPANATIGSSYARFRYSNTPGLGVGGTADTGEVEDYTFPILGSAEVANNDNFTVSRNSLSNQLDVLANDFETLDNPLSVVGVNLTDTDGTVVIAQDGSSIFYTPQNGFVGRDVFSYTVENAFGQRSTATVVVNVTFQTANPIAIDDSFEVPEGSVNRPLNVLDNDIPSLSGGLTITSVTAGDQGGQISIVGGGQSIRYTPLPGFNGTEQFTYSIQDAAGTFSSATVTVNLLTGSRNDDIVDYSIGLFDVVNNTPITNVQVGDIFNVRVFVDDLGPTDFGQLDGVASGFLDLLYTDELVATRSTGVNPIFPFDITFGPLFTGDTFQQGNSLIPGILDEVGGVQILNPVPHSGPVELFTVTMQAVSPGVAIFQADPADNQISETTVIGSDVALPVNEIRLGRTELLIAPSGADFASAIDDSFPAGVDSAGNPFVGGVVNRLDVLANDNFGPTGTLSEIGIVNSGDSSLGTVSLNDNGTPTNFNDDFIEFAPSDGVSGFNTITYLIVSADGIRSVATVTMAIGDAGNDDILGIDFELVDENGTPITSVSVGQRFGVQVVVEDLRSPLEATHVFAAGVDVLYDSGIIAPSNQTIDDEFDFDVLFGANFNESAGVGTSVRPGIIDEFWTVQRQVAAVPGAPNPNLMATIFFDAVAAGTTNIVGGPADNLPSQDSLVFGSDVPVTVDRIRYDNLQITVGAGSGEGEIRRNDANPADVNNDGFVSAVDALAIINRLPRLRAGLEGEAVEVKMYLDSNGDGNASAADALYVVNRLNEARRARLAGLESEFVSSPSAANESGTAADEVFATLNDRQLAGDQVGGNTADVTSPLLEIDLGDDEDDVLDLLAGDISDQLLG